MTPKNVLVVGGVGYIGSHVARLLLRTGHRVSVLDDLSSCDPRNLQVLSSLAGADFQFCRCDIRDEKKVQGFVEMARPEIIFHIAGLKDASESFQDAARYHAVNVGGTENLVESADRIGVERFVFSSSAAVYGATGLAPITECHPTVPISPYGETKLLGESLVKAWAKQAPSDRRAIIMRYFNPCCRHPDFVYPKAFPKLGSANLADAILGVVAGDQPQLTIFGNAHPTPDGTCQRDFVHIEDIAQAHIAAIHKPANALETVEILNIGSGATRSVLEFITEFERISGVAIPCSWGPMRVGDAATSVADVSHTQLCLDWRPSMNLSHICLGLVKHMELAQNTRPRKYTSQ